MRPLGVVEALTNGQEALAYLWRATRLPCLILLELHMPVMNAWDFRAAQLLNPRIAHIPVVLYLVARNLELMAIELGAVEALPKTIDSEEILAVMRQYCGRGDTEAGAL